MKISDIGNVITGNTPSKSNWDYYCSNDIPFIKPDVIDEEIISDKLIAKEYISEKAKSVARIIQKGTVVVTCIGSIGKIGIVNKECAFNQQINAIIPNNNINSYYLALALKANKNRLIQIANAPVVPIINKTQFENFTVNINLDQSFQVDVVKRINGISKLIEKREQQLASLDDLIKSRFVELFGDPVKNTKGLPVKKLKDLCININSGNTPKGGSEVYVKNGITFFRSQNVWKDNIVFDDIAYIDEDTHFKMKRSSLKHGDILMTKTGRINTENSSLGRAAIYDGDDDKANVNGHVYFIRLKPGINNRFILTILISNEYRDYIRSVCVGGIDKRQLNKEHIENFPIICPPQNEINEYVEFVNQINKSKFD